MAALADVAHRHGVPLVVDNTVATPILFRPIEHGADIVMESLTKFMGGHGTTLAGAVIDSAAGSRGASTPRKYPMFTKPDESYHGMVYADHYGAECYIARARSVYQRTCGAVLSPFNAFLILQGIETVALRMERHVANARAVAEFLRADPRVDWVNYAGFPDSPYYELSQRTMGGQRLVAVHLRRAPAASRPASTFTTRSKPRQAPRQHRRTRDRSPATRPRPRTAR